MKIAFKWLGNLKEKHDNSLILLSSYQPPDFTALILRLTRPTTAPFMDQPTTSINYSWVAMESWTDHLNCWLVDLKGWLAKHLVSNCILTNTVIADNLTKQTICELPPTLPITQLPAWIKLQLPSNARVYSYWINDSNELILHWLDKSSKWLSSLLEFNVVHLLTNHALQLLTTNQIPTSRAYHHSFTGIANFKRSDNAPTTAIKLPSHASQLSSLATSEQSTTKPKMDITYPQIPNNIHIPHDQAQRLTSDPWLTQLLYWWIKNDATK